MLCQILKSIPILSFCQEKYVCVLFFNSIPGFQIGFFFILVFLFLKAHFKLFISAFIIGVVNHADVLFFPCLSIIVHS